MNFEELRSFCWTKMQAEAGQSLVDILRRKELERAAGNGVFYWGVGNSLGNKTAAMMSGEVDKIVFSKMLSSPKKIDINPSAISLWLSWKDLDGNVKSLPAHVAVISRAHSNSGTKSRHYALVCWSDEPLLPGNYGTIKTAIYRNYGSTNHRIGSSQVTTILERNSGISHTPNDFGHTYQVNLIARLIKPYFVTLMNPVVLSSAEALELKSISAESSDGPDYLQRISEFRSRVIRDIDLSGSR